MTLAFFNMWEIVVKGGFMMWPILLLSIMLMALVLERLKFLRGYERRLNSDQDKLIASLRRGKIKETLLDCEKNPGPLGNILKAGIQQFSSSADVVRAAMEQEVFNETKLLQRNLSLLSVIVNLAPLLGMLGSVNSMVTLFRALQVKANFLTPMSAGDVSMGLWQSLISSSAGLTIGILAFGFYSLCAMKANDCTRFLERFTHSSVFLLAQLAHTSQAMDQYDQEA